MPAPIEPAPFGAPKWHGVPRRFTGEQARRIMSDAFDAIGPCVGYEARCDKCGETFNPSGDEDVTIAADGLLRVEHYQRFGPDEHGEYETECGGFGPILGGWR